MKDLWEGFGGFKSLIFHENEQEQRREKYLP